MNEEIKEVIKEYFKGGRGEIDSSETNWSAVLTFSKILLLFNKTDVFSEVHKLAYVRA